MSTCYVLVHGAWHGGWCWDRVADGLRGAGHRVLAPTLSGLAASDSGDTRLVNLETHINDVVALMEVQALNEVTLVGHSYGGIVIAGVADRVPQRIARLVFLDGVVVGDGQRWADTHDAAKQRKRIEGARSAPHGGMEPPDVHTLGLRTDVEREWVRQRLRPQPLGTYLEPLRLNHPWGQGLPCVYIDCMDPSVPTLDSIKRQLQQDRRWTFLQLRAGHDAMVSEPLALCETLLRLEAEGC